MECRSLTRRRVFEPGHLEAGNLKRCLTRWDLCGLGVGSTLGVGVYVLIGYVALHLAGPSVVLSILIAAVAALLAGVCFAEFGCRVPRAGSSYIYTYATLGEVLAFFVGWCNIFECLFGAASIAKGLSTYVDLMTNHTMSEWLTAAAPISVTFFSPYFDVLAFVIVIAVGILLAVGARETASVNNVLAAANVVVILFVLFAGAFTANPANWSIPESEVPASHGTGGFFPFGVWGTLKGAAICFYGFVGFETISASSEEARKPRHAVPSTILTVIAVAFLGYTSVAIVITMMVPYYLHDPLSAVAMAFDQVGWSWAMWVVSIGALFGILAGLIGAMFPLPRLLYAMSSDGLLLGFFSKLTVGRKSPAIASILSAGVIATLAGIFDLHQLIMMMCIGTLISYTLVAISVIVVRYRSDYIPDGSPGYIRMLFGCGDKIPTQASARVMDVSLGVFIGLSVASALVAVNMEDPTLPCAILNIILFLLMLLMTLQPKIKEELAFKTPLVPLVPCVSIYINIHLLVLITPDTWIRTIVWIIIGIPVYFIGICCNKKSKGNLESNVAVPLPDKNGKSPVQIIVESPTPPGTITRRSNYGGETKPQEKAIETPNNTTKDIEMKEIRNTDEIILHQAYVENNEEKEAKIIDLLDQVIQAEEDSYGEIIVIKENTDDDAVETTDTVVHRKSLSELSDAGSDASLGNQVLSKYDVIAQVHREDLPRVNEDEERIDRDADEHEQITAFNDSDTTSRTDESGYSDTLDRNASLDGSKENTFFIPVPPPLDENFFKTPERRILNKSSSTNNMPAAEDEDITSFSQGNDNISPSNDTNGNDVLLIPVPPPMDENYFKSPEKKKFYSLSSRRPMMPGDEDEGENKPRESIKSNNSQSDDNIIFGSDRQVNFMSKLTKIFQNQISSANDEEEPRRRSHSTGNVAENTEFSVVLPPPMFLELKKEIQSGEAAHNLRPVNVKDTAKEAEEPSEGEDTSLSREDLKSKLETIFAIGGPQLLKPRLMKSNPPTPEEAYQTDTSSSESIAKLPKMEKNDTLKRQKAKFGDVLNSFRLSLNKDDEV